MDMKLDALAREVAREYAGKDWHKLSARQREIVRLLEELRYLRVNKPANGFVGTPPPGETDVSFFTKMATRKPTSPAIRAGLRKALHMD